MGPKIKTRNGGKIGTVKENSQTKTVIENLRGKAGNVGVFESNSTEVWENPRGVKTMTAGEK